MIASSILTHQELAIARSVVYAGLFDYPLTLAQLRQTLIQSSQTPSQILANYDRSETLRAIVDFRDGMFYPRGRAELIAERRQREARSRSFLRAHRLLLGCICAMPYVRMVALSGSIAHLNLERDGDLDLFIVTRGYHAWTVTVAVVALAKLLRKRRIVCANYTVADTCLEFEEQDLFTASQIIHLRPIVGRDLFHRLLRENPFVHRYYPNFHEAAADSLAVPQPAALIWAKRMLEKLMLVPSALVERLCRAVYGWHLKRRSASWHSPEQVRLEPGRLKLHTHSHRRTVLDRFERSVGDAIDGIAP
jgi:hypothetical protein